MPAYGFQTVNVAIAGPNGNFLIGGPSAGNTEGGITVAQTEDRNNMNIGAGGEVMHSLHTGKSGTVTVRLQKVAPVNAALSIMFAEDTSAPNTHGQNTITIRDLFRGDLITCTECAFARFPDIVFAKEGGEQVWTFHAGKINYELGDGVPVAA